MFLLLLITVKAWGNVFRCAKYLDCRINTSEIVRKDESTKETRLSHKKQDCELVTTGIRVIWCLDKNNIRLWKCHCQRV